MNAKIKITVEYRVYNLPLDLPAIVLTGDEWRISDIKSSRLHFHNCLEIGFCHSDEGTLLFEGGEKVKFRAGDITIIPRYVPHTTYSRKGTRSLWSYLFIDFVELFQGGDPNGDRNDTPFQYQLFNAESAPRLSFLANCMREELINRKSKWVQIFQSLAFLFVNELQRLYDENGAVGKSSALKSFVLKPALEYIRRNYMNVFTIKDLSDICHVSENHFRRLFLSIIGTSPLNFINVTRINHACLLLDTTDLPVFDVANAVGISSFSKFNRNFKSLTGLSPREYRKLESKNNLNLKHKNILTYQGWLKAEDRPESAMDEDED